VCFPIHFAAHAAPSCSFAETCLWSVGNRFLDGGGIERVILCGVDKYECVALIGMFIMAIGFVIGGGYVAFGLFKDTMALAIPFILIGWLFLYVGITEG